MMDGILLIASKTVAKQLVDLDKLRYGSNTQTRG